MTIRGSSFYGLMTIRHLHLTGSWPSLHRYLTIWWSSRYCHLAIWWPSRHRHLTISWPLIIVIWQFHDRQARTTSAKIKVVFYIHGHEKYASRHTSHGATSFGLWKFKYTVHGLLTNLYRAADLDESAVSVWASKIWRFPIAHAQIPCPTTLGSSDYNFGLKLRMCRFCIWQCNSRHMTILWTRNMHVQIWYLIILDLSNRLHVDSSTL